MGTEHPYGAENAQTVLTRKPLAARLSLIVAASVLAGSFAMAGVAPAALGGGTLDNTFNTPRSGANEAVSKVLSLADGKSIIGGAFTRYNGVTANHIALLNADGSLDRTFAPGTAGPNGTVASMVEQSDHKIIIVGTFTKVGASQRCGVARLNADGTLDTGFATGAGATKDDLTKCAWVSAVALQGDKPIISGLFAAYGGIIRNRVARLNTDGSIDATFNPDVSGSFGITTVSGSRAATLASTHGLAPSTTYRVYSSTIPKSSKATFTTGKTLTAAVTLSTTVGVKAGKSVVSTVITTGANGSIGTIAVQPEDGKVLIGGTFTAFDGVVRNRIARLTVDGGIDSGFSPADGPDASVNSISLQSDGGVVIGGAFTHVAAVARNRIARLGPTGALDPGFAPSNALGAGVTADPGFDDTVYSVNVLEDKSILVVGGFKTYSGNSLSRIAKLQPSGALDTSLALSPALAVGNTALTVAADASSGQLLIGGFFFRGVARLSATGTLDADFNPSITSAANGTVGAIVPLAGAKVLIGGGFTKYNGTTRLRLARLNADGGVDTTFNPMGVADGEILVIHPLTGGQFLIGGSFTHVNGVAAGGIALMNEDGSLDDTFALGAGIGAVAGATPSVDEIQVQTDGKIILGGHFTTFNGLAAGNLVRLLSYGVVDTSFAVGTGADAGVHALKLQADGKLL
ncbi:MAG: delta-60 repeat domain-containing protein, partial [Actinomycetes bacterium]